MYTTQATIQQNGYAVRNLFDLAEDMRGYQDGMGGGKGPDQFAHLNDLAWVKAIGGFVQEEQRRVVEQRLGNGDPLAIPARQLPNGCRPHVGEMQTLAYRCHTVA